MTYKQEVFEEAAAFNVESLGTHWLQRGRGEGKVKPLLRLVASGRDRFSVNQPLRFPGLGAAWPLVQSRCLMSGRSTA